MRRDAHSQGTTDEEIGEREGDENNDDPHTTASQDALSRLLTRGRAEPPFPRTLAVSEPVGRDPITSLAESVPEIDERVRARSRATNPLDLCRARDATEETLPY